MILYINADDNPVSFNKKNYLLRAADRLGLNYVKDYTEKEEHEVAEYVLNVQPCRVVLGSKWSALWHIDTLLEESYLPGTYPSVDKVYISTDQGKHPQELTDVLFQACDPELHRRHEDIEQEYDFIQCGSNGGGIWNEREKAINLLREKGFSFKDYGKEYKPYDYVKNYNTAKVQFIRTGESDEGKGAAAQRFFECLAIGPVLTNWTGDLPLTGLKDGTDYLSYVNDEQMIRQMHLLINDKKLRDTIAASGRRKALLYHSYESRLVAILNDINELCPSKSTPRR